MKRHNRDKGSIATKYNITKLIKSQKALQTLIQLIKIHLASQKIKNNYKIRIYAHLLKNMKNKNKQK
jgi:hypothetical protein